MTYGNPIPLLHTIGPQGLSQGTPPPIATSSDPFWARLLAATAVPFAQAGASRIAHGQTPAFPTTFGLQTPFGPYSGYAGGGFDPKVLLAIGGALLVVLMVAKR